MQNRLKFCSVYLKEVETKLIHLRASMADDSEAKAKITEALRFIEQAHHAVSEIEARIKDLQHARTHLVKRQSA